MDSAPVLSKELACSPSWLFPQNSTPITSKFCDTADANKLRFSARLAQKHQIHAVDTLQNEVSQGATSFVENTRLAHICQSKKTPKHGILSGSSNKSSKFQQFQSTNPLSNSSHTLSSNYWKSKRKVKQDKNAKIFTKEILGEIKSTTTQIDIKTKKICLNTSNCIAGSKDEKKHESIPCDFEEDKNSSNQNTPSFLSSQDKLELSSWGLPEDVLQKYKENGISQMFSWQVDCLSLPGVLEGSNLVYSAPTSAGKTLVAEIILLKRVLEMGKKGIFILPFVSVAREKTFYLQRLFGGIGVKVEGFMGGQSPPGGFQNADIAICTIEKANNLVNRLIEEQKVDSLGIIVVDELHMVGDHQRGYLLELLLTKLKYIATLRKNALQIQVIGMSATLPNLHVLAKWQQAQIYLTSYRPIPLLQMVKIGPLIYKEDFTLFRDLRCSTEINIKDDQDHLIQMCLETVLEGFSILLFCPTKAWCEKVALSVASSFFAIGKDGSGYSEAMVCGLRGRLNAMDLRRVIEALRGCPAGLDPILEKALSFGAGFHHAGLTFDERDILEGAFRAGYVPVLVATSTLSSGVNLPARRVIVRSPNSGSQIMDPLVYKQMIGRAGRKGKDTQGESILMCAMNERHKAERLVSCSLPPITSCLQRHSSLSASMKRAVLEIVVSGAAKTANEIKLYWNCTLLAASIKDAQEKEESPSEAFHQPAIEESIQYLLDNELARCLEEANGESAFVGTQLGSAILASGLSPDEGLHVFSELQRARQCFVLENELHVVYQVTPVYVSDSWPSLDWLCFLQLWDRLSPGMKKVGELVGVEECFIVRAMKGIVNYKISKQRSQLAIHQRFYAALALHDLVHEVALSAVVNKYGATKGLLQALQLSAATFAGMVTIFCNRLGWHNLELLIAQYQNRLQFGIQRDLCDLVRLSLLNGRRARMLFDAGLETVAQIAHSNHKNVENILLNAGPFQSCKDEAHGFILGPNGRPLSLAEATKSIVNEARSLVQKELGLDFIDWNQRASNKVSAILKEEERSVILVEPKPPLSLSYSSATTNSSKNIFISSLSSCRAPAAVCKALTLVTSEAGWSHKSQKLTDENICKKEDNKATVVGRTEKNVKGGFTTKEGSVFPLKESNNISSELVDTHAVGKNSYSCSTEVSRFENLSDSHKKSERRNKTFESENTYLASDIAYPLLIGNVSANSTLLERNSNERDSSRRSDNSAKQNSSVILKKHKAKGSFLFAKHKKEQNDNSHSIYIPESQERIFRKRNVSVRAKFENPEFSAKPTSSFQETTPETSCPSAGSNRETAHLVEQNIEPETVLSESLKADLLKTMFEDDFRETLPKQTKDRSSTQSEDLFDMSEGEERKESTKKDVADRLDRLQEFDPFTIEDWSQWGQDGDAQRSGKSNSNLRNEMKPENARGVLIEKTKVDKPTTPLYRVCSERVGFTLDDSWTEEMSMKKPETNDNWLLENLATDHHVKLTKSNSSQLNDSDKYDSSFRTLVTKLSTPDENSLMTDVDEEESVIMTEAGAFSMTRRNIEEDLGAFESSVLKECQESFFNNTISSSFLEEAGEKDPFQVNKRPKAEIRANIENYNSLDWEKERKNEDQMESKNIETVTKLSVEKNGIDPESAEESAIVSPLSDSNSNIKSGVKVSSSSPFYEFSSIILTPGIEAVLEGNVSPLMNVETGKKNAEKYVECSSHENDLQTVPQNAKLILGRKRKSEVVKKKMSDLTLQNVKEEISPPVRNPRNAPKRDKSFGFSCKASDTELDQITTRFFESLQQQRSFTPSKSLRESTRSLCIIDVTSDIRLFDVFLDEWKSKERFALCLACEKVPSQPSKGGIGWRFFGRSRRTASHKQPVAGLVVQQTNLILTGIAISWGSTDAYYINLKTSDEVGSDQDPQRDLSFSAIPLSKEVPLQQRINAVKDVLCDETRKKTIGMWNVKDSLKLLCRSGIGFLWGKFEDPNVAVWLLDPTAKEKNLHNMVISYLDDFSYLLDDVGKTVGMKSLGICDNDGGTSGSARVRSAIESVLIFHLNYALAQELGKVKLRKVWESIEMPVIFILALLEMNGVGFCHSECQHQKVLMQEKLDLLESEAFHLAGHPFTLSSPDEVAKILYLELRLELPTDQCMKTSMMRGKRSSISKKVRRVDGPTNKEALQKLQEDHPLPKVILEWRKIKAAMTKVVYPLCQEMVVCRVLGEERIFPDSYAFTATGRITFHEPNIQNIPKDFSIDLPINRPSMSSGTKAVKCARDIGSTPAMRQLAPLLDPISPRSNHTISLRNAIVAGKGRLLLAADYSQLELRILAHLSEDEGLLAALKGNEDVFKSVAARIYSVSVADVTDTLRQEAKQICYGIIYGMGERTLREQLGISEEATHSFVAMFHQRFPRIRQFVKKTLDEAREQGSVVTLEGRKRFLPTLFPSSSSNIAEKGQGERQAVNTRIQGSAADIVKKAMIAIQKTLRETFPDSPETLTQPVQSGQALSGAYLVLQLHDELIYEVISEDVIQVAQIVKHHMETACLLSVQLPVKIKVGPTWGSVQTLNL